MVEAALDFFFYMLSWAFNDFLLKVKILGIPVLYYFLAILILGFIIGGLVNSVSAGRLVVNSSRNRKSSDKSGGKK